MLAKIPPAFLDLIEGPVSAAFTTVMPDGQPQTTVVWCNSDGEFILVNTMSRFQKARNMRRNPKVTLFAYDLSNTLRFIEVRGRVVEMTEEGAFEHLDQLAKLYVGRSPYFGEVIPVEWKEKETPVLCKIEPVKVVAKDYSKEK
jgi:PPOX class probable F420-dependent enzyme